MRPSSRSRCLPMRRGKTRDEPMEPFERLAAQGAMIERLTSDSRRCAPGSAFFAYPGEKAGARAVAMEVSSHGLVQGRVNGVRFACALFTNLSHDHLDYHGSMQAYGEAKAELFEISGLQTAVLNLDDAFGVELARRLAGRVRT